MNKMVAMAKKVIHIVIAEIKDKRLLIIEL